MHYSKGQTSKHKEILKGSHCHAKSSNNIKGRYQNKSSTGLIRVRLRGFENGFGGGGERRKRRLRETWGGEGGDGCGGGLVSGERKYRQKEKRRRIMGSAGEGERRKGSDVAGWYDSKVGFVLGFPPPFPHHPDAQNFLGYCQLISCTVSNFRTQGGDW
ncbi:hypothetical protein Droror1_Dr00000614 [Drosera rotundifolia]